jgi:hypothetical protein
MGYPKFIEDRTTVEEVERGDAMIELPDGEVKKPKPPHSELKKRGRHKKGEANGTRDQKMQRMWPNSGLSGDHDQIRSPVCDPVP